MTSVRVNRAVAALGAGILLTALTGCYLPGSGGDPGPVLCPGGDATSSVALAHPIAVGQQSCNDVLPGLTDVDVYLLADVLPGGTPQVPDITCTQVVGDGATWAVVHVHQGEATTLDTGGCEVVDEPFELPPVLTEGRTVLRIFHPETSGQVSLDVTVTPLPEGPVSAACGGTDDAGTLAAPVTPANPTSFGSCNDAAGTNTDDDYYLVAHDDGPNADIRVTCSQTGGEGAEVTLFFDGSAVSDDIDCTGVLVEAIGAGDYVLRVHHPFTSEHVHIDVGFEPTP